jgi:hypothetical protein
LFRNEKLIFLGVFVASCVHKKNVAPQNLQYNTRKANALEKVVVTK